MAGLRMFWTVLVVFLSFNLQAQDAELIGRLRSEVSKHHHSLSYSTARQFLLGKFHLRENKGTYYIQDVYCLKDFTNSDFGSKQPIGPNKIPDSNVLNTEHTWPQSRFSHRFPKGTQKTDLHHLFPTDSKMNAMRGNFKFGEVNHPDYALPCKTAALGRTDKGMRFEPPDSHKGNVARALFYFSVRYNINIDADEEKFLRTWHVEDPVDEDERRRNDEIEKVQGNRNPFVDHPEFVSQISNF